jgi:hypothetical protein
MRIASEIWIKAFLRAAAADGLFGAIVRKGDAEAGAIFIKVLRPDRTARLFGPAPAGLSASDAGRLFVPLLDGEARADADVETVLEREVRYDSDLWIVEIEHVDGRAVMAPWLARTDAG